MRYAGLALMFIGLVWGAITFYYAASLTASQRISTHDLVPTLVGIAIAVVGLVILVWSGK